VGPTRGIRVKIVEDNKERKGVLKGSEKRLGHKGKKGGKERSKEKVDIRTVVKDVFHIKRGRVHSRSSYHDRKWKGGRGGNGDGFKRRPEDKEISRGENQRFSFCRQGGAIWKSGQLAN